MRYNAGGLMETLSMRAARQATVDHVARRQLAEALRHFASGRITTADFDYRISATDEKALYAIDHIAIWPLYGDDRTYKLSAGAALTEANRKIVARVILFLRSGQPYRFPTGTSLKLPVLWPVVPVFIGWASGSYFLGIFSFLAITLCANGSTPLLAKEEAGEFWPFRTKTDYETALASPVYLRGSHKR